MKEGYDGRDRNIQIVEAYLHYLTKMKAKISALFFVAVFSIIPMVSSAATPMFITSETANVSATDDQTAATVISTANVAEVKASSTLAVASLPVTTETITVGSCTITFATTTSGSPAEDANCTGGATILTTTGTSADIARTTAQIAAALRTLTNVSDAAHGALTVGGSGTNVTFTTTGTETSATNITFSDGTGGNITLTAGVSGPGVVPVAQINTITIGGTVEAGDIVTATLPTVGAVNYTVLSTDPAVEDIAIGLNAAIQASAGYSSQAFTSAVSTNVITLTAKTAGTGFTQTSGTTNRSIVAQVAVFTPTNVSESGVGYTYTIEINDTEYQYVQQNAGESAQTIVEALQPLADADAAVSCSENDVSVTCTAASAGTPFYYAAYVTAPTSHGSSRGGGGGGGSSHKKSTSDTTSTGSTATTPSFTVTTGPTATGGVHGASTIARRLNFGVTGEDVSLLQRLLAQDPTIYPEGRVTGYFGPLTQAAVEKFQLKHSIVAAGVLGYGWVGPLTRAKLIEVYGE